MIANKYSVFLVGLILFSLFSSHAYAITASLGNAKAIINVEMKESPTIIDRAIKVSNVNNEDVDINLEASGEYKDLVTIKDKEFSLKTNESKDARYSVALKESGNYEIRIVVTFTPKKGQAVGLSSVLIIKAIAEGDLPKNNNVNDNGNSNSNNVNNTNDSGFNFNPKNILDKKGKEETTNNNEITGNETSKINFEVNGFTISFIILIVIVAILGGFYYLKRS